VRYFELSTIPNLVIIGQDGKTLNPNVAELIEEHGIEAYPFTPEKLDKLAAIEKAKLESLESVLVNGENDFVIDKSGSKVIFLFCANIACCYCITFNNLLIISN